MSPGSSGNHVPAEDVNADGGRADVSYRRHAHKPTAALWMLVAAADVGLVLASLGALVLVALASAVVVTVASIGTWRHLRPSVAPSKVAAAHAPVRR